MKRVITLLLTMVVFVSIAHAESENMGISTQNLLDSFAEYRQSLGLKPYPTNLFEREINADSVNLQISDYCRIDIKQSEGMVVGFTVITNDDVDQSEACSSDIIMTFTGVMMVSNSSIDNTNVIDLFQTLVLNREDVTIGGVTYHYASSSLSNIVALYAKLEK